MTQAEFLVLLQQIDANTNNIASSIVLVKTTADTIKTDVEALLAALQASQSEGTPVTQAIVDAAQALVTKTQAASDSLTPVISELQGIAAEGTLPTGGPTPTDQP